MNSEHGKIKGDVFVDDTLDLHGMIAGNVVAGKGSYLILHGMICETLTLETGSVVVVHGMVCKDIINNGGDLKVFGMVNGIIYNHNGELYLDRQAIVKSGVVRDIIAYHQTTWKNAESILADSFDLTRLERISIGYGVQCFLQNPHHSVISNYEGQLEVRFIHCRVLQNEQYQNEMLERILTTESGRPQLNAAKLEASILRSQGIDAYIIRGSDRDTIVFVNPPEFIKWISFED
jgi:hypothetical protein